MNGNFRVQFYEIRASLQELEIIVGIMKDCWRLSPTAPRDTVCELLG